MTESYYWKHRDEQLAKMKERYRANREKLCEYQREYERLKRLGGNVSKPKLTEEERIEKRRAYIREYARKKRAAQKAANEEF
jgi:hypothetical protein